MKRGVVGEAVRYYYSIYGCAGGHGGVVASDAGLREVFLPTCPDPGGVVALIARLYPSAVADSPLTLRGAELLGRYFAGEATDFDLPLDLTGFTPFQRAVYGAVAAIPRGVVKSYGRVAEEIGRPNAARGVGSAMARNRLPIVIPCHRVVGSSGAMTGYSAPGGVEMKRRLLRMEGVEMS